MPFYTLCTFEYHKSSSSSSWVSEGKISTEGTYWFMDHNILIRNANIVPQVGPNLPLKLEIWCLFQCLT